MKRYYVVFDKSAPGWAPMELCCGGGEIEIALWHSDHSTVFHSYQRASTAIRTTMRYAKRHNLPWKQSKYRIMQCEIRFLLQPIRAVAV